MVVNRKIKQKNKEKPEHRFYPKTQNLLLLLASIEPRL